MQVSTTEWILTSEWAEQQSSLGKQRAALFVLEGKGAEVSQNINSHCNLPTCIFLDFSPERGLRIADILQISLDY